MQLSVNIASGTYKWDALDKNISLGSKFSFFSKMGIRISSGWLSALTPWLAYMHHQNISYDYY